MDKKRKIHVCHGPSCGAQFATDIMAKCEQHFASREDVEIKQCGCTGHCSLTNNVVIDEENVISRNTPQNAVDNIEKALAGDVYGAGGGVDVDPWNLPDDEFLGINK